MTPAPETSPPAYYVIPQRAGGFCVMSRRHGVSTGLHYAERQAADTACAKDNASHVAALARAAAQGRTRAVAYARGEG